MLVRGMRNPVRKAGTDLDDNTGPSLSENGPKPAKLSSLNSDGARNLKGRTAAGLSTDMTRRSRDIDILHATADEHHDILENMPPFQSLDGSVDSRRRSIPIRRIHRPLDHDDNTLRFRRNGKTPSAGGASNGPINQPFPEATVADLKGMRNHSVRQLHSPVFGLRTMPSSAVISPPDSSTSSDDENHSQLRGRRIENLKNLQDAISQIPQHREGSPSIRQETIRVGAISSAKHAEILLLQAGLNPSSLNPEQFATFVNQSPAVQQKTLQTYAANLQQQQSQQMGKPMSNMNSPPGQGLPMVAQAPDGATINSFYNAEGMAAAPPGAIGGPGGPNATQQAGGSNAALQDYQMQLMLLEQQNKARLVKARQEQDGGNNMPMPRDGPSEPGQAPYTSRPIANLVAAPNGPSEHPHHVSNSQQVDASNSAMSKVPLARRKANLPGRGKDVDPKDNDPKLTTNATISKDNTMGAEARINELFKNWGSSKMKLVTGPSLPADSDDNDSDTGSS